MIRNVLDLVCALNVGTRQPDGSYVISAEAAESIQAARTRVATDLADALVALTEKG